MLNVFNILSKLFDLDYTKKLINVYAFLVCKCKYCTLYGHWTKEHAIKIG